MRKFITRSAWKQARKSRIKEEQLVTASNKTNDGLVDAKIGAHLYKQHVGRKGDFRAILYVVQNRRSVVLHIFPKNEQPNITGLELEALRDFVDALDVLSDEDFMTATRERGWKELTDEKREEDVQERPPSVDP